MTKLWMWLRLLGFVALGGALLSAARISEAVAQGGKVDPKGGQGAAKVGVKGGVQVAGGGVKQGLGQQVSAAVHSGLKGKALANYIHALRARGGPAGGGGGPGQVGKGGTKVPGQANAGKTPTAKPNAGKGHAGAQVGGKGGQPAKNRPPAGPATGKGAPMPKGGPPGASGKGAPMPKGGPPGASGKGKGKA
jgi:hypothetical protein